MIQFIIFSRGRPLQLHGCLTSLYTNWGKDRLADLAVSVIYRADPTYAGAYAEVVAEFPQVQWRPEGIFGVELMAAFNPKAEYTCFGCDDVVYVDPIRPAQIEAAFKYADLIGFSLRLGRNVLKDMYQRPMSQPPLALNQVGDWPWFYTWDVTDPQSTIDWAYPWEVLGTVYPTEFVARMLPLLNANSPSQVEARGALIWQQHTSRTLMACAPISRLVVPTVNLVQAEYPNGIVGEHGLAPEFLLECWHQGLRMDIGRFDALEADSWRIGEFFLRRQA